MQPRVLQRFALTAVLVLGAGVSVVSTAAARPVLPLRPGPRVQSGAFNLFAGSRIVRLNNNRVDCNAVHSAGFICYDPSGSGTVEAGYWPNGTADNYVFNSGLQIAATVYYDATKGQGSTGPWVGDTVGVYIMDPRGTQIQSDPVTNIYSSLNAADVAAWPTAAYVKDASLYNTALLGRLSISQQDTWTRYWDGNPAQTAGRKHAMGLLVEQRGLLWNYPSGNQDILYFLFRFINITATNPAAYAGLTSVGYSASDVNDIVAIAQDFHNRVAASYNTVLPANGYTFRNTFAAIFQDPDEGNASFNYSSAILPFSLAAVMKSNYSEPLWQYPASAFGEPFYPTTGFEGVKYLKSPVNQATGKEFGISVWGNTCNGCGLLNDAVGVPQMYRYLSGRVTPALGDGQCNSDPILLHVCAALQAYADTRFYMSSGPFDLAPGESSVIVVALIFAAPVHKWAATTNGLYSLPAGQIEPYVNPAGQFSFLPGWPASPDTLALAGTGSGARTCTTACTKAATVRDPVERAMGWGQFSDADANGTITQNEVQTVPGSLLDKAKVAQAIFDAKFLLPFAPEGPQFYVVPGDGLVTVLWTKSPTETVKVGGGDPYFAVASDVTNALYDPDYRQYDVEGYRVWRGRTAAQLSVIAQFDYAGTSLIDYTGQVFDANHPNCAPELGLGVTADTTVCGVRFTYPYRGVGSSKSYDLAGDVVQIPPGGRVQLQNGNVFLISADTAVTGGGVAGGCAPGACPALTDGGVPFAYQDNTVLNGFQYFYAVTAFDVNSVKSGPSSLQSAPITKGTTPHATGSNAQPTGPLTVSLQGANHTVLDPTAFPTIDATKGTFSGPAAPTDALISLGLQLYASQLLKDSAAASVTVDSVLPLYYHTVSYFLTVKGLTTQHVQTPYIGAFGEEQGTNVFTFSPQIPADPAKSAALHVDTLPFAAAAQAQLTHSAVTFASSYVDYFTQVDGSFFNATSPSLNTDGGSRWFDGANETMADPTLGFTHGQLTGVTTIYEPTPYVDATRGLAAGDNLMRRWHGSLMGIVRAADIKFYWGTTAGKPDSVIDVTHHVPVPFSPQNEASYGFLNDVAGLAPGSAPDGVVSYHDLMFGACQPGNPQWSQAGCLTRPYASQATLGPVDVTGDDVSDGNGFAMYVSGEPYFFLTSALPVKPAVWTLRSYSGLVTKSGGRYTFVRKASNAIVPGLSIVFQATTAASFPKSPSGDLSQIHTVPDPYYVTNSLETSPNIKVLRFVNLPSVAIIRIYSVSGILVRVLTHNDPNGGGEATWDLRNRNNQYVASGVYFYHVEAADGRTKVGRFTVVNFAQ
jgi:hypothetical protein